MSKANMIAKSISGRSALYNHIGDGWVLARTFPTDEIDSVTATLDSVGIEYDTVEDGDMIVISDGTFPLAVDTWPTPTMPMVLRGRLNTLRRMEENMNEDARMSGGMTVPGAVGVSFKIKHYTEVLDMMGRLTD